MNIIEPQVFVYNLGTMYYIDGLLYPEILESVKRYDKSTTPVSFTTIQEVERIPIDIIEPVDANDQRGMHSDSGRLDHDEDGDGDGEVVTPRALPVLLLMTQPQK